jgi:hypothetical protein
MSKGSNPRPYSVDQKTFDANWDAIFKKKQESVIEDRDQKEKEKENELVRTN